eukprot:TRINITY_DN5768_c0_g2_i1.p1 TRINITY_DN5768_c0_g2~~TRINITY_DN5768_c0_g2_i1.p1  ORF type:complete len:531 (+),score=149.26 TRINITY_DN5768_c0_g2_i1:28-1620(+)
MATAVAFAESGPNDYQLESERLERISSDLAATVCRIQAKLELDKQSLAAERQAIAAEREQVERLIRAAERAAAAAEQATGSTLQRSTGSSGQYDQVTSAALSATIGSTTVEAKAPAPNAPSIQKPDQLQAWPMAGSASGAQAPPPMPSRSPPPPAPERRPPPVNSTQTQPVNSTPTDVSATAASVEAGPRLKAPPMVARPSTRTALNSGPARVKEPPMRKTAELTTATAVAAVATATSTTTAVATEATAATTGATVATTVATEVTTSAGSDVGAVSPSAMQSAHTARGDIPIAVPDREDRLNGTDGSNRAAYAGEVCDQQASSSTELKGSKEERKEGRQGDSTFAGMVDDDFYDEDDYEVEMDEAAQWAAQVAGPPSKAPPAESPHYRVMPPPPKAEVLPDTTPLPPPLIDVPETTSPAEAASALEGAAQSLHSSSSSSRPAVAVKAMPSRNHPPAAAAGQGEVLGATNSPPNPIGKAAAASRYKAPPTALSASSSSASSSDIRPGQDQSTAAGTGNAPGSRVKAPPSQR